MTGNNKNLPPRTIYIRSYTTKMHAVKKENGAQYNDASACMHRTNELSTQRCEGAETRGVDESKKYLRRVRKFSKLINFSSTLRGTVCQFLLSRARNSLKVPAVGSERGDKRDRKKIVAVRRRRRDFWVRVSFRLTTGAWIFGQKPWFFRHLPSSVSIRVK